MITPDQLKKTLLPFIKTKEADKVGVVFFHTYLQVSRFANSQVHQHMSDEQQLIYFRVAIDGRLGVASTNSFDDHNLNETFKKALHRAQLKIRTHGKKDIPFFLPLHTLTNVYYPETAHFSPRARVKILQKIFTDGQNLKIKFSGNFYNGLTQYAVISPQGKLAYQDYSFAGIKFIATQLDASGYAAQTGYNINQLNPKQAADTAMEKCLISLKKINLPSARYDVILEPQAVADIIHWLNYIGFGAKSVVEETSFLHGKAGKRITGDSVTLYDSGADKNTFILPFDFEGQKREKVYLIKKGIAGKPLCDSYYAGLLKMKSNGHANFPDDVDGPLGYNIIMEGGKLPQDEITRSAKRAILITRFHYINGFLNTHKALMTGMTRDGTFLIKNGKIKSAIKDMRFTESILEAFSRIKHISKERALIADHLEALGSVYTPTLYIKDFNFTS